MTEVVLRLGVLMGYRFDGAGPCDLLRAESESDSETLFETPAKATTYGIAGTVTKAPKPTARLKAKVLLGCRCGTRLLLAWRCPEVQGDGTAREGAGQRCGHRVAVEATGPWRLSAPTPNGGDQWLAIMGFPCRQTLSRVHCIAWFHTGHFIDPSQGRYRKRWLPSVA